MIDFCITIVLVVSVEIRYCTIRYCNCSLIIYTNLNYNLGIIFEYFFLYCSCVCTVIRLRSICILCAYSKKMAVTVALRSIFAISLGEM